jgi:hypothetical protein
VATEAGVKGLPGEDLTAAEQRGMAIVDPRRGEQVANRAWCLNSQVERVERDT